jgi:hypothetical protein
MRTFRPEVFFDRAFRPPLAADLVGLRALFFVVDFVFRVVMSEPRMQHVEI